MGKATLDAHTKHAWTLAISVWAIGAAGLYVLHHLIGDVRDLDVRWWMDAGLYIVAFAYMFAFGALQNFFLSYLSKEDEASV